MEVAVRLLCAVSIVVLAAVLVIGCAPSHAGRTLGREVIQFEGGLGGPMVTNLGGAIPVPNVPLGVRYGVTDRTDVSGHVNLLPLFMGGFMTLDAGATYAFYRHSGRDGFNLAGSAGVALLTDFQDSARVSPLFDIYGGYTYSWFTVFGGGELVADFWGGRAVVSPQVGFEADIGSLTLSAAFVWHHVGHDVTNSSIRYVTGSANRGAAGVLLGIKYRWDLAERRNGRSGGAS